MDRPLKGDDANTRIAALLRGLADTGTPNAFENISTDDTNALANELLDVLDEREQDIIKHTFEIDGMERMTLNELGDVHNLSRERIRQLKVRGLRKMRAQAKTMKARFEEDTEGADAECQQ
jgi:RNA polymerase primary sigma factor